jgi:hypothetical protein
LVLLVLLVLLVFLVFSLPSAASKFCSMHELLLHVLHRMAIAGHHVAGTGNACSHFLTSVTPSPIYLAIQWQAIEGPTCFGGLKDLLCATPFTISSTTGGSGDRGMITKNRPEDCLGMCCAVCTDVDGYTINLAQQNDAVETATTLGAAIQLDFMFFEKDNSFCEYDAQNEIIYITMCYWYMCGLLVPCKCCISTRQG